MSGQTATLPTKKAAGAFAVAAAARPWETLGAPVRVTWFPRASHPVVLASPGPGAHTDPLAPIRLTFSQPVSQVLERQGADPDTARAGALDVPGRPHAPLPARRQRRALQLRPHRPLPVHARGHERPRRGRTRRGASTSRSRRRPSCACSSCSRRRATSRSTGRRRRRSSGRPCAASSPPPSTRPPGTSGGAIRETPHELQSQWQHRRAEPDHARRGDDVPGRARPRRRRHRRAGGVARGARRRGRRQAPHRGYSYVYVHRNVPQKLTLWHNGQTCSRRPATPACPRRRPRSARSRSSSTSRSGR